MVVYEVFGNAGKEAGLRVWRIKKMAPVLDHCCGEFYTGDSYLVLHTSPGLLHKIHAWFGDETSPDERGSAAILMMQLDDHLGGCPVQYTEHQYEESDDFMIYFSCHITYKCGGHDSGFSQGQVQKKQHLLHVKGRRRIRAKEVPFAWSSFNKGDCFIIDLGENLYHWSGSECNFFERLKATELAIAIRDNEQSGRGKLEMIDEGSEPEDVIEALGKKPDLPSGCCDSDKLTDAQNKNMTSLYLISDAAGSMKTTMVQNKIPFKQDQLSQSECYILDNGGINMIFVWKGQDANADERKAALTAANKFIEEKKYPKCTPIQVMPAGGETTLFKQFFFNWLDKDETTGLSKPCTTGHIAKVEQTPFDASKLHNHKCMAAQHCMVDNCSGDVKIWRVEEGDKVPVDKCTHGQFFGGDCYLVLYCYKTNGREKHIIYIWQGQKCTRDELGASAILAVELDNSMGGVATQVRVTQGQEPPHLVGIFKEKSLVVHLGGTSRQSGESKPGSTRLFHIRQNTTKATRAVEVEPTAFSLNSNDVFVLKSPKDLWVWKGEGGTEEEMTTAKYVAGLLGGTPKDLKETKETHDFWAALGGKKDYQTSKALKTDKPPKLFACSNKTGRLIAEQVFGDFTQLDLASDDVMILDAWDQIFVWVGIDANETEKTGSLTIAKEYEKTDNSGRLGTPIVTIKQGNEPLDFIGWFQAWDPEMFDPKKWDCNEWGKNCGQCLQTKML